MPQSVSGKLHEDRPIAASSGGWHRQHRSIWRDGVTSEGGRDLPRECPIALIYDAATYAVMMATPCELEDFAVGFSLSEGVIDTPGDIEGMEIVTAAAGTEVRMWLGPGPRTALARRRRHMAGPTGCGLCGLDSLNEAARPPQRVDSALRLTPDQLLSAMAALPEGQDLGRRTHAAHAAGFWTPHEGRLAVREDVGRHNALDKLAGALARGGRSGAEGAVLLTSRVSVEMVQKTAVIGAGLLIAVSAPTTLAVETAEAAGVTLVAVARADGFEVFTHPGRVTM